MAVITVEGLIEIDMVDVHQWLSAQGWKHGDDAPTLVAFSIEEDALEVSDLTGRSLLIESVDLWTWLIDKVLAKDMRGWETVFGVPTVSPDKSVLCITFASSSHSDPRSWATRPACMDEWTEKAALSA